MRGYCGKRAFFLAFFPDSCHNSHALASKPHTIFYSVPINFNRPGLEARYNASNVRLISETNECSISQYLDGGNL